MPGIGQVCNLKDVQTRYGTPRTVAGEAIATDINKCQLKPLRRSDYYPITFTDAQWAQLQAGVPDRRLRLEPSRASASRARSRGRPTSGPTATSSTAAAARPGADGLGHRLDQPGVQRLAGRREALAPLEHGQLQHAPDGTGREHHPDHG